MTRLTSRQLRALNCALLSLCEDVTHPQPFESISDSFETALPVSRISVKRKRGSQIVAILGVKVRTVGTRARSPGANFRSARPAPRAIREKRPPLLWGEEPPAGQCWMPSPENGLWPILVTKLQNEGYPSLPTFYGSRRLKFSKIFGSSRCRGDHADRKSAIVRLPGRK